MAENQTEAVDTLLTLVNDTWTANADGAPLFFENQDEERPEDLSVYGRAVVQHASGSRSTLGGVGQARFRRVGTVYVQCFIKQGEGTAKIRVLSDALAHALEDVPSNFGVRMADVDINELGSDGVYYQINVAADFSYDRQS